VKPKSQTENVFPQTDCFFQARDGRWRGYGGEENWNFRRYNLGREYLIESARERTKEMIVFAIILAAAAWPVFYMIFVVVQLLRKGRP
jgi:hypothetical protein